MNSRSGLTAVAGGALALLLGACEVAPAPAGSHYEYRTEGKRPMMVLVADQVEPSSLSVTKQVPAEASDPGSYTAVKYEGKQSSRVLVKDVQETIAPPSRVIVDADHRCDKCTQSFEYFGKTTRVIWVCEAANHGTAKVKL